VALRVYITPWVGSGTREDPYRSKAVDYYPEVSTFFPSKVDGTPASAWVVAVIRSSDFTAIDADSTCDDLFAGDLPGTVQTRDDLLTLLRSRTVANVPTARRNAITAVLDKYGVVRSDVVGSTPLWKVMQRVISTALERDDNFGAAF
jgi:hypothetical protein